MNSKLTSPDKPGFFKKPGLSTFANHLRNILGSEPTPVLMIVTLDRPESVEQAFDVGATDYITQPINWLVLRHRVRHLIQNSLQMRYIVSVLQQLEAANQELQSRRDI